MKNKRYDYKGSEAILIKEGDTIIKERIRKEYRDKKLDDKIRLTRTRREVKMMNKARSFIETPQIFEVNKFSFRMEFINSTYNMKPEEMGEVLSKLHTHNIIHGDFTPNNIIGSYVIDFGLSFYSTKVEDKADDLIVAMNMIDNKNDFLSGYKHERIVERAKHIMDRVRYAERIG